MPDGQLDPTSRATFARSIESLHEEFRGIYSLETIERFVDESIDCMAGAPGGRLHPPVRAPLRPGAAACPRPSRRSHRE